MNFKYTADRLSGGDDMTGSSAEKASDFPINRPTNEQPTTETDGLDPATPGGASPYNGAPPFGQEVTTDPLVESPTRPGKAIPAVQGPDTDTNTLSRSRQGR